MGLFNKKPKQPEIKKVIYLNVGYTTVIKCPYCSTELTRCYCLMLDMVKVPDKCPSCNQPIIL